ncbi:MAG: BtpA/SgcQ family protein [Anaerolineales bacterium]
MDLADLFNHSRPIIGMIHLLPLPGSPNYSGNLEATYERAMWEADVLTDAGVDGLIIENFGDIPYRIGEPDPVQLAVMAGITSRIRKLADIPLGVNVQFNAWQAEIAVAFACQANFARVEVFVDTVVSPQGIINPCSAEVNRYRQQLNANNIYLLTDIQTKYTQNIFPKKLTQSAKEAVSAGAHALIVTGAKTGQETPLESVAKVKKVVDVPVLVGSGTTPENVKDVLQTADGAIVGSALKEKGEASNQVSPEAVHNFMKRARS